MTNLLRTAIASLMIMAVTIQTNAAEGPTAEQVDFFEKQVRPLLVQNCQECHGAKKQEASLRLDSHAGLLKGSDGGPIIVAGNIDGSRLFQVLKYADGQTQMPPKGKLPDDQIVIIHKWLEMGSPWPAEVSSGDSTKSAKEHWAFQPVKLPSIPTQSGPPAASETQSPIDSFITAALAEKQLSLSPPASRETFIRRATLDLWGIPATFEQVREFADDPSPDAYERLIDRLLASPLYGQRWGRHWLDIARYADSKGYVFTQEPPIPLLVHLS